MAQDPPVESATDPVAAVVERFNTESGNLTVGSASSGTEVTVSTSRRYHASTVAASVGSTLDDSSDVMAAERIVSHTTDANGYVDGLTVEYQNEMTYGQNHYLTWWLTGMAVVE